MINTEQIQSVMSATNLPVAPIEAISEATNQLNSNEIG